MVVRTRFAPSPTGFLHIGSARTALYSWLYARKQGGQFILRIEDTDRERSTQKAVDAILEAMTWLALDWDEGPFYQTQHFDRYRAVAEHLLASGHAYRCTCSKERLDRLREQQLENKQKPRYDGQCRECDLPLTDVPHVLRFKNPLEGCVKIEDCIKGSVVFQNAELDDLILLRSDGTPTYNFTVVVDDWDMQITHVIRGDDHLTNTPRQINLFKALGAPPPLYGHVSMILGVEGKRLSKRQGAVSVQHYQAAGILPHALLNYLVRLGWSHGDQEIFSRAEMIELFDISDIHRAPTIFNTEKLMWLNQHYIKTDDPETLVPELAMHLRHLGVTTFEGPALIEVVKAQQERAKTLREMAEKSLYFYQEPGSIPSDLYAKHFTVEATAALSALSITLATLADWQAAPIHQILLETADRASLKLGQVAQPLRIALTGGTVSPPMDITMALIGQERSLKRLNHALGTGTACE